MNFTSSKPKNRLHAIDEVRGLCLFLMVVYHLVYDIIFVFNMDFGFFFSPTVNILRDIFAGAFIFIAGISRNLSRNNLKSGIKVLLCAFLVSLVTFRYGAPIIFGILHFMGVAILLSTLFIPWIKKIPPAIFYPTSMALFAICKNIPSGYMGFKWLIYVKVPPEYYSFNWLAPLGFPPADFVSFDYFPIIPWLFLFLLGIYFGRNFKASPPLWIKKSYVPFLGLVGRHTLVVYLLHQPVVMGIVQLVFLITSFHF